MDRNMARPYGMAHRMTHRERLADAPAYAYSDADTGDPGEWIATPEGIPVYRPARCAYDGRVDCYHSRGTIWRMTGR